MRLAAGVLVAAFLALAYWTFVNWFVWSMADFDCADGYWVCRRHLLDDVALQVGLPWLVWCGCAVALARFWKRA